MKKCLKKILGVTELEKTLSTTRDRLSKAEEELSKVKNSQEDDMWKLNREVDLSLQSLEDKVGWRKVTKDLKNWSGPHEFVEFYAHVYVLDKGYRKILPAFVKSDIKGTHEIDKKDWLNNDWDGEYELRCYMVTKLVVPGYFKLEELLSNDSNNFTLEKMFGKNRKQLVEYMEQFNFERKSGDTYTLDFYEI